MVQRFGIQDHDTGIQSTRHQNPTAQGSFQNLGGGDGFTSNYSGPSSVIYNAQSAYDGPRSKGMIASVLLALFFGPFGLAYTTFRGAAIVLGLLILAGVIRGGGFGGLDHDSVMEPLWKIAVVVSVAWTIYAGKQFNAREIERDAAKKAAEADKK
jgi:hypothetical protein